MTSRPSNSVQEAIDRLAAAVASLAPPPPPAQPIPAARIEFPDRRLPRGVTRASIVPPADPPPAPSGPVYRRRSMSATDRSDATYRRLGVAVGVDGLSPVSILQCVQDPADLVWASDAALSLQFYMTLDESEPTP